MILSTGSCLCLLFVFNLLPFSLLSSCPRISDRPHHPSLPAAGIGAQAAELLAADPAIVGVGIDTPSIDPGTSATFSAHVSLFKAGKFGLENIADMSRVPAKGAT